MTLFQAYRRAWQYYRSDFTQIAISVALVGLTTLTSLAQPFVVVILIGCVLPHKPSDGLAYRAFARVAPAGELGQITFLAIAFLVLRVLGELLGFAQGFYTVSYTHLTL